MESETLGKVLASILSFVTHVTSQSEMIPFSEGNKAGYSVTVGHGDTQYKN